MDYQTPHMYTTVYLLPGGNIVYPSDLDGYEHSRINIRGSDINSTLRIHDSSCIDFSSGKSRWIFCHDSSQVDISGGEINRILSRNFSQVNISGGLTDHLITIDYSYVDISGGSIKWELASWDSSRVNISGGEIYGLYSANYSQVDISGGKIVRDLYSNDSSQVNISGGSIPYLWIRDSSQVNITSGSILNSIKSDTYSQVNIYGGLIGGDLLLDDLGMIQIFGYDFAVDGQPFGYGEITSIFGGWPEDEPIRHLTGTLLNGGMIDSYFYIGHDAKIVLIPEPATVLLLGIGFLFLRKRHDERIKSVKLTS